MFLWHLGGTVAIVRYAFRDDRMDLRLLLVGAVLPDLIDTPLGAFGYSSFDSIRLFAHTMLFASAVLIAVLVSTRRGRPRKRWMPLAVGVLVHLVLDGMWSDPETLWWPFLGTDFASAGEDGFGALLGSTLTSWRSWILEAIGAGYVLVLAVKGRLGSSEARTRFRNTGRIDVPIDRR